MVDINKVTIRGRAAASAEWKDLPNTTLVTLRVATSDDYTDRDGRKGRAHGLAHDRVLGKNG